MKIKKSFILLFFLAFTLIITGCDNNNNSRGTVQILNLKANGKHLLFYGSRHSNDSSNPMFKDIEEYFYSLNPQIVFVEGDFNNSQYRDKESAIRKGESAFVAYLAENNNVIVESVEPSMEEQFDYLLKKYDRESTMAMYILRQIYQYQSQNKTNPILFMESMEQFVSHLVTDGFPLSEEEANFKSIQKLLKPYLQIEIDENNWTTIDVYSVVYKSGNKINDIYSEIYTIRNEKLKSNIENSLLNYDRIFVIMGSDHVLDEKDNIKHIFNNTAK